MGTQQGRVGTQQSTKTRVDFKFEVFIHFVSQPAFAQNQQILVKAYMNLDVALGVPPTCVTFFLAQELFFPLNQHFPASDQKDNILSNVVQMI